MQETNNKSETKKWLSITEFLSWFYANYLNWKKLNYLIIQFLNQGDIENSRMIEAVRNVIEIDDNWRMKKLNIDLKKFPIKIGKSFYGRVFHTLLNRFRITRYRGEQKLWVNIQNVCCWVGRPPWMMGIMEMRIDNLDESKTRRGLS